jgi:RNA polymerase sigma factor (sigma-70 family)
MVIGASERPSPDAPFWEKAYINNYQPLCWLVGYKLTHGNADEAEETVSEAFRRAIQYTKKPETITNLPGYLWTIAKNVWVGRLKKERTASIVSLDNPDNQSLANKLAKEIEPDLHALFTNQELRANIKANQGPLTPREDSLLELHLKGYSCAEIAAELEEDVRAISVDLNAVRSKVRGRLQNPKAKRRRAAGSRP